MTKNEIINKIEIATKEGDRLENLWHNPKNSKSLDNELIAKMEIQDTIADDLYDLLDKLNEPISFTDLRNL